jgi:membrane protein involved in colicin uptake
VAPESTPTTYTRGQTQADIDKQTALTSAQDARQAALDASAQARQEAIAARADQASQQRQTQLQIAGMANDTRRAVAEVGAGAARDKAAEKQAAAEKETQGKRQAALRVTNDSLDALSEVLDVGPPDPVTGKETYALKPGVGQLYGARVPGLSLIPGTDTANAAAAMNRLRGRLVTDLLGELKSQSKTGATGFGALSEKELAILQQSASKLENSGMSDSDVLNELVRIRERLLRAQEEPGAVRPNGPQQPDAATSGVPKVGGTFQGGTVTGVRKIR